MTDGPMNSRPARVLFLDHTPAVGGAELVLATHIAALDRSRFTPVVACTDTVPMLLDLYRDAGAEVHVLPMPQLRRASPMVLIAWWRASRVLRSLLRRLQVDLIVANTSRAAYIASLARVGTGVPLIWWVRDFLFGDLVFRLLSRSARRLICVSAAIRDHYGGRGNPRFAVVHVGSPFDDELTRVTDADVRAERARWGFTDNDVVVGFMGRLVEEKGPEDVLDAVAIAHATDPRIRVLVVGSGRGQVGDVEDVVHARAAIDGGASVVFAGFQREQALYYRLFDVFVLATRTPEPYATSVVQAMMAGTPVIATATGGTPELVRDGVTGLLVPPRAPRAIADAILRLASSSALRARLVEAAQSEVLAHNREATTTALVESIYEEVLAPRPD